MKCEMYWGFENAKPCTNETTAKVEVAFAGGGKKRISMCEKCQKKYFGKVRRPTKRALDGAKSAPDNRSKNSKSSAASRRQ